MLTINTNLSSLIAQNSMKTSTNKLNQAIERMSTGFKINHSKDNAANYSISTNMSTKIGSLQVAEDNALMGLDLITTATGNLELIQDKLTRLRDLQEQASNGTYGEQSLKAINSEANALVDEINRLYEMAEYNGVKLFGAEETQATQAIATFSMTRSTVKYTQYDDDYVIFTAWSHACIAADHMLAKFSDGTTLCVKEVETVAPDRVGGDVTWGDLVIPSTYTWDENNGCYVDSSGNAQSIIVEQHCFDVGDNIERQNELDCYGVETIVDTPDVPDPDPSDPDTPGGSGGGNGGTGSTTAGTPAGAYAPGSIVFQIGTDSSWSSQIGVDLSFTLDEIDTLRGIGLDKTTDYFTILDNMLETVSAKQVQYGASQNRLESALDEISTKYENLVSSRSTLRDADIAETSSQYIQQQILQQASATLLSTANQSPSIALQLI